MDSPNSPLPPSSPSTFFSGRSDSLVMRHRRFQSWVVGWATGAPSDDPRETKATASYFEREEYAADSRGVFKDGSRIGERSLSTENLDIEEYRVGGPGCPSFSVQRLRRWRSTSRCVLFVMGHQVEILTFLPWAWDKKSPCPTSLFVTVRN